MPFVLITEFISIFSVMLKLLPERKCSLANYYEIVLFKSLYN